MDTNANWAWINGRDKPDSLSPTELKRGKNTIRIVPREASASNEPLMDVFVVSTKPFKPLPTDDNFNKAKPKSFEAVQLEGNLATTWGSIKGDL